MLIKHFNVFYSVRSSQKEFGLWGLKDLLKESETNQYLLRTKKRRLVMIYTKLVQLSPGA